MRAAILCVVAETRPRTELELLSKRLFYRLVLRTHDSSTEILGALCGRLGRKTANKHWERCVLGASAPRIAKGRGHLYLRSVRGDLLTWTSNSPRLITINLFSPLGQIIYVCTAILQLDNNESASNYLILIGVTSSLDGLLSYGDRNRNLTKINQNRLSLIAFLWISRTDFDPKQPKGDGSVVQDVLRSLRGHTTPFAWLRFSRSPISNCLKLDQIL